MILLLDNYDSFNYNLAQYLGELGCELEVRRNDKITLDEIALQKPEKIVISPGPRTPSEAGISVELIRRFAGKIPILGVCLGHQAIGEAFGGRVVRAKKIITACTGNFRGNFRWHDHGPAPSQIARRRRAVPSGIRADRTGDATTSEFPRLELKSTALNYHFKSANKAP